MPVYDTPLHTNDQSLERVLQAGLPVALVLWDSRQGVSAALEAALNTAASAEAGSLLVARVDTTNNPRTAARWPAAALPALVGFSAGQQVLGPLDNVSAEAVHSAVDYLLGRGEKPAAKQASGTDGTTSAWTRPVTVTDASFQQEVLESPVPVVVDFWAPWCGPCRMIGPALERIATEFGGRVKIAKVNVDEHQRYAGQYGVQGIPTLLIVKEGRVVDRLVGALPEPALRQRIRAFVS